MKIKNLYISTLIISSFGLITSCESSTSSNEEDNNLKLETVYRVEDVFSPKELKLISNNWDNLLDVFDNFADEYLEKFNQPDRSDLLTENDFSRFMIKGDAIMEIIKNIEISPTTEQKARLNDIYDKISSFYTRIEEDENPEASTDAAGNWDELLDQFDEFADKSIEFEKKSKNGEFSSLEELPELMSKGAKIMEAIANMRTTPTPEQEDRLNEINKRLEKAKEEME